MCSCSVRSIVHVLLQRQVTCFMAGPVASLALAGDGGLLAVSEDAGAVCIARLEPGGLAPLALLPNSFMQEHGPASALLAWSPDSAHLLMVSPGGWAWEAALPAVGLVSPSEDDVSLVHALEVRRMHVQPSSGAEGRCTGTAPAASWACFHA